MQASCFFATWDAGLTGGPTGAKKDAAEFLFWKHIQKKSPRSAGFVKIFSHNTIPAYTA